MGARPGRAASWLHGAIDRLAMGVEGLRPRAPVPFRPGPVEPLLPGSGGEVPEPPAAPATWRFPAPAWGGPQGDRVEVRLFAAAGRRLGTAIVVPPWKQARPWLYRSWISALGAEGWEVWFLVPPLHLGRSPPGVRSGEAYVSPDLGRFAAALGETAREIAVLAAAAARRGPVGLLGLSLGGLASAHALAVVEPLAFAALVAPPVDLAAHLAGSPIFLRYRRLAGKAGAPFPAGPALAEALARLAPSTRPPACAHLLVAAGSHDLIVPAEGPARLARAWGGEPRLFPRGHLTLLFGCRALRRELAALARGAAAG